MLEFDKKYADYTEMLQDIPRETIGSVDGVPITIPVEVPASIPFAYNRTRLARGDDIAVAWALDIMLTDDGMNTLMQSDIDEMGWAQLVTIVVSRVRGHTTGTADAAPKASTNGSPNSSKPAASRRRPATKK